MHKNSFHGSARTVSILPVPNSANISLHNSVLHASKVPLNVWTRAVCQSSSMTVSLLLLSIQVRDRHLSLTQRSAVLHIASRGLEQQANILARERKRGIEAKKNEIHESAQA